MKTPLAIITLAFSALFAVTDAQAVVCARGVYRAGCAGPNGAVVARRPVYGPARPVVVTPAPVYRHGCRWVWINGRRVCR